MRRSTAALLFASYSLALISGCKVGPTYKMPAAVTAPGLTTFKEPPSRVPGLEGRRTQRHETQG